MVHVGTFEKRIGQRHRIEPIPIGWRVEPKGSRWGRRKPPQRGEMLEVSLSGAAVRAPLEADLHPGALVRVEVDGTEGQVIIRRITPGEGTPLATYGVEFAHPNGRLAQLLTQRLIPVRQVAGAADWIGEGHGL